MHIWMARCLLVFGLLVTLCSDIQANQGSESDKPFKMPFTYSSEQWAIEVKESSEKNRKPNVSHAYEVILKNVGKAVSKVTFEAYRPLAPDPQSTHEKLIGSRIGTMHQGRTMKAGNIQILKSSPWMELMITWEKNGRKYKQSLVLVKEEKQL